RYMRHPCLRPRSSAWPADALLGADRRPEGADRLADRNRPRHSVLAELDLDHARLDDYVFGLVTLRDVERFRGVRLIGDHAAVAYPRRPSVARPEEHDDAVGEAIGDDHVLHAAHARAIEKAA